MPSTPITIGILAHVDAGKTSLTESLLFKTGTTKQPGSVDKGSAITDGLPMEKSRGISIESATVDFTWNQQQFFLVDTPGHVDFSAEVDRALSVLDMVILVVSAKEGVQAHTISLWENIRERQLPVVVFFNKIDRPGVNLEQVFEEFEKDLGAKLFALNQPNLEDPEIPKVTPIEDLPNTAEHSVLGKSLENLAEKDEAFLEIYLEGKSTDFKEIRQTANSYIDNNNLVGAVFGSAKMDLGIETLLEEIARHKGNASTFHKAPAGKVFKVSYTKKFGRLIYLRSYGTTLKSKDQIWSQRLQKEIKINQLYRFELGKIEQVNEANTGEIVCLTASEQLQIGDVLGRENLSLPHDHISESVLSVQVVAQEEKDYQKLGESLEILFNEDPRLEFQWFKDVKEYHIRILGPMQIEILKEKLLNRFGVDAEFLPPQVIYKETPSQSAEGFVRYWMPKPCWAIMTFKVEPLELGSGVRFESKVGVNDISKKYQNEVERAIPKSLEQGIKGWEVTDVGITLLDGSEHTVHSNPGDFILATPMGVMRGLENAGTDLLEPMYAFQIKAHQNFLGSITSDLNQMHAQIDPAVFDGDHVILTGRVSVALAMDYSIKFNASTSGKGRLKLTPDGYAKTETTPDKIRPYNGVSPLDESQWILHMRGAFKAQER